MQTWCVCCFYFESPPGKTDNQCRKFCRKLLCKGSKIYALKGQPLSAHACASPCSTEISEPRTVAALVSFAAASLFTPPLSPCSQTHQLKEGEELPSSWPRVICGTSYHVYLIYLTRSWSTSTSRLDSTVRDHSVYSGAEPATNSSEQSVCEEIF